MKRKLDPLEKLLRRPAAMPKGLRQRTLQRMGLHPRPSAWVRWGRIAAPLAGMAALLLILNRPSLSPPPPLASHAPSAAAAVTAKSVPAAARPAAAQTAAAVEEAQTVALMSSQESAGTGAAPAVSNPAAVSVSVSHAPGEAATGEAGISGPGHAEPVKAADDGYTFTVRGNRLRPALGEHLHVELRTNQAGRVLARVYDLQGRLSKELLNLSDPQGTVEIEWDGNLSNGLPAPSGAYVLIVESPAKTEKVGVLILR
jgi:hypothetical protein